MWGHRRPAGASWAAAAPRHGCSAIRGYLGVRCISFCGLGSRETGRSPRCSAAITPLASCKTLASCNQRVALLGGRAARNYAPRFSLRRSTVLRPEIASLRVLLAGAHGCSINARPPLRARRADTCRAPYTRRRPAARARRRRRGDRLSRLREPAARRHGPRRRAGPAAAAAGPEAQERPEVHGRDRRPGREIALGPGREDKVRRLHARIWRRAPEALRRCRHVFGAARQRAGRARLG